MRRKIWLVNDIGKWQFEQEGIPFQFEDKNAYEKRKKTDRFTFESIEKILDNLGVHPFDEDFYITNKSSLVEL